MVYCGIELKKFCEEKRANQTKNNQGDNNQDVNSTGEISETETISAVEESGGKGGNGSANEDAEKIRSGDDNIQLFLI